MAYDPRTELLISAKDLQHAGRKYIVTYLDSFERAVWGVWSRQSDINLLNGLSYKRWLYDHTVACDKSWGNFRESYFPSTFVWDEKSQRVHSTNGSRSTFQYQRLGETMRGCTYNSKGISPQRYLIHFQLLEICEATIGGLTNQAGRILLSPSFSRLLIFLQVKSISLNALFTSSGYGAFEPATYWLQSCLHSCYVSLCLPRLSVNAKRHQPSEISCTILSLGR